MSATKFIVLAGGIIGIIAFFLPLIAVKQPGITGAISAFQVVKGIDTAKDIVKGAGDAATDAAVEAGAETAEAKKAVTEVNDGLSTVKNIFLAAFAPALFLALIGGFAVMRKQFGRLAGTGALIFGLLEFGVWALLNAAANEVAAKGATGDVKGIGMHLLLVTGLAGVIGGILGLAKPERKVA